jgi:hypothetical protein
MAREITEREVTEREVTEREGGRLLRHGKSLNQRNGANRATEAGDLFSPLRRSYE